MEEYEIKAIAGTVDVEYQNIPFFSVYDIFDDEKLNVLKRIASDEVAIDTIVHSLSGVITSVDSLQKLILMLQKQFIKYKQTCILLLNCGGCRNHDSFGFSGRCFN